MPGCGRGWRCPPIPGDQGDEQKLKVYQNSQDHVPVHYAPLDHPRRGGTYEAIQDLFQAARIADAIEKNDVVAIKVHFGELGNTRYLRPILIRRLAELVKAAGGRPFVTDTTTLYKHHRHDLFRHLENARANGFTPETLGCPVIIADGLCNNGVEVAVEGNQLMPGVTVAQAIYDADMIINAAHLTLHHEFLWAGAVKAIGMGCTTKQMKLLMHTAAGKPSFCAQDCVNCGLCLKYCPGEAFQRENGRIAFDVQKCLGCGDCFAFCTGEALQLAWGEAGAELVLRTAECARGVLSTFGPGKAWHFLFAVDVTENCDCIGDSAGRPITPDLGLLLSEDVAAVDLAALDLAVEAGALGGKAEAALSFKALIAESVLQSRRYAVHPT